MPSEEPEALPEAEMITEAREMVRNEGKERSKPYEGIEKAKRIKEETDQIYTEDLEVETARYVAFECDARRKVKRAGDIGSASEEPQISECRNLEKRR